MNVKSEFRGQASWVDMDQLNIEFKDKKKENENTELGGRDAKNRQIIHKKHSIQSRTTPPKPPSHGTAPNHSQSRPTPIPSPFPSGILSSL
ncbi:hypothetical protein F8388_020859 [Cannabis sativa]|uniref:Uncharacterized protein n=1 Tax=Cannabis sativa TaxID=3483 RepID=A0A7J6FK95_CANSA|nr:hypothetical protein F8388_020859 [Cannabis sativa]